MTLDVAKGVAVMFVAAIVQVTLLTDIDVFHGLARSTGPDAIAVEGQELKARHVLIAAGARPVPSASPARSTS